MFPFHVGNRGACENSAFAIIVLQHVLGVLLVSLRRVHGHSLQALGDLGRSLSLRRVVALDEYGHCENNQH